MRRPPFGELWSLVRRQPLLREPSRSTRRGYDLTTAIAAIALAVRSLTLAVVYVEGEPVAWLLAVKVALGLPVTLIVIAAAYAADGLNSNCRARHTRADRPPEGA